jgi:hypothetical protein
MSSSKEDRRRRAEASFKKKPTTQAELAKVDEEEAAQAVREKTARLRSQRLAKEVADKQTASDDDQT